MKKLDNVVKNKLKQIPGMILFSSIFIAFGAFFLFLQKNAGPSEKDDYLIGIIVCLGIGIFILLTSIVSFFRWNFRGKEINKLEQTGTPINAKIVAEKISALQTQLVCSAEINGVNYEFISEDVDYYTFYACQELGITEIPVYVNMQNPKEYVVDVRSLDDIYVDLT